jgi:acetyl esterase/lipase
VIPDVATGPTRYERNLDPELAPGLAAYRALGFDVPSFDEASLVGLRARAEELREQMVAALPLPAGVVVSEHRVPGPTGAPDVGLRVLSPASPSGLSPCIYSIHSGGMVMGGVDQDDLALAGLVLKLGCVAVSVDYRLAPEHPYPAGVEDCYAGLVELVGLAAELSIDADRIAVLGSSGGGGLAAALTLLVRDRGGPELCLQALLAPMLDDRETPSAREFAGVLSWSPRFNECAWRMVLGDAFRGPEVSPYAAPARAIDLTGLPPAIVQVGELEVFRDEDIHYAGRLLQAGVATELHVYPGAYHGSEAMAPNAKVSVRSRSDRVEALRRAFAGSAVA